MPSGSSVHYDQSLFGLVLHGRSCWVTDLKPMWIGRTGGAEPVRHDAALAVKLAGVLIYYIAVADIVLHRCTVVTLRTEQIKDREPGFVRNNCAAGLRRSGPRERHYC